MSLYFKLDLFDHLKDVIIFLVNLFRKRLLVPTIELSSRKCLYVALQFENKSNLWEIKCTDI